VPPADMANQARGAVRHRGESHAGSPRAMCDDEAMQSPRSLTRTAHHRAVRSTLRPVANRVR